MRGNIDQDRSARLRDRRARGQPSPQQHWRPKVRKNTYLCITPILNCLTEANVACSGDSIKVEHLLAAFQHIQFVQEGCVVCVLCVRVRTPPQVEHTLVDQGACFRKHI